MIRHGGLRGRAGGDYNAVAVARSRSDTHSSYQPSLTALLVAPHGITAAMVASVGGVFLARSSGFGP